MPFRWPRKSNSNSKGTGTGTNTSKGEASGAAERAELAAIAAIAAASAVSDASAKEAPSASPGDRADGEERLLVADGVRHSFLSGGRRIEVLKGIDLAIEAGRLTMLRGRSGSGKTTLLNIIGGLERPTAGSVAYRGKHLYDWSDKRLTVMRRQDIGFIFQSSALMPLLSARENVELSLRMAGRPRAEWKARTAQCLELVGLTKRADHRPNELSGGEQQRVAIAKAIAHRPRLLLADEPTAELDSSTAARIIAIFRDIVAEERIGVCMTTHDPALWEVADIVFHMADGRIGIE